MCFSKNGYDKNEIPFEWYLVFDGKIKENNGAIYGCLRQLCQKWQADHFDQTCRKNL